MLACASSNIAVDNLAERLAKYSKHLHKGGKKIQICRVGHPARLLPSVLSLCLDALVLTSDEATLCKDIRREMNNLLKKMKKVKTKNEKFSIRSEMRELRKELYAREKKRSKEVLDHADVILCTNLGLSVCVCACVYMCVCFLTYIHACTIDTS